MYQITRLASLIIASVHRYNHSPMDTVWRILAPLALVVLNGYFVATEFCAVTARPTRLKAKAADSALYRPYVAAPRIWENVTPLVDQQLGGLVMWVGGGTFFLGVFVAVFLRWAQLNERAESQGAPSRV